MSSWHHHQVSLRNSRVSAGCQARVHCTISFIKPLDKRARTFLRKSKKKTLKSLPQLFRKTPFCREKKPYIFTRTPPQPSPSNFRTYLDPCKVKFVLQYRPKVSYHLSSRFSRDVSCFSWDISRFSRESLKHLVWHILRVRNRLCVTIVALQFNGKSMA